MTTSYAELSVPKAEHHDVLAAKRGDLGARYRVMMRARADPEAHGRTLAEIVTGLHERWERRWDETALEHAQRVGAERTAWANLVNDELVFIAF